MVATELVRHYRERGWVVLDLLDPSAVGVLRGWVDEIAALPDGAGGVLQHHEATDAGRRLCRSERFVDVHAGLRHLLCTGALAEAAAVLLGEPVLLYKEKVNHKPPGGAGYRAHQDAPAYPLVSAHVSAMVAIDDCDAGNGGLEVVSGRHHAVLPLDDRGCIEPSIAAALAWEPVALRVGQTLWFHSRTPHRSGANRSSRPRRALYPTYNAAREGDRRAEYYAVKDAAFTSAPPPGEARVSLIGDFEGRPA